jgi:predicted membrane chloride channel (bestrophin family)
LHSCCCYYYSSICYCFLLPFTSTNKKHFVAALFRETISVVCVGLRPLACWDRGF